MVHRDSHCVSINERLTSHMHTTSSDKRKPIHSLVAYVLRCCVKEMICHIIGDSRKQSARYKAHIGQSLSWPSAICIFLSFSLSVTLTAYMSVCVLNMRLMVCCAFLLVFLWVGWHRRSAQNTMCLLCVCMCCV